MSKSIALCLLPLVLIGCEDLFPGGGLEPVPWVGTHVQFSCEYDDEFGVGYAYLNEAGFPMTSSAHPDVSGCLELEEPVAEGKSPPWVTDAQAWDALMYNTCTDTCVEMVNEEANSLGRTVYAQDCYVDLGEGEWDYFKSNCGDKAEMAAELELTYTPTLGSPITLPGSVSYSVRDSLTVSGVTLHKPLSLTTGLKDVTVLLGYPDGTVISVDRLSLDPVSADIDRVGVATFKEGAMGFFAHVTVTEPRGTATEHVLKATNPWTLNIDTSSGLVVEDFTDAFGGSFSVR